MIFAGRKYHIEIWDPKEGINTNNPIAIDTETTIVPFTSTPDLVTFQAFAGGNTACYVRREHVRQFLDQAKDNVLVFHNAPFDIDVIEKAIGIKNYLLPKIDSRLLKDTQLMWKLVHLAEEGWVPKKSSLAFLIKEFFNLELDKNSGIREDFTQFLNQPVENIPKDYSEYAMKDVVATYHLYKKLAMKIGTLGNHQELSLPIQVAGALALNRIYKRGIGFDLEKSKQYLKELDLTLSKKADKLRTYGWVRGIPGSKQAFERVINWLGISLPKTESGDLSSKEEDLEKFKDSYEFIQVYLDYHSLEKTKSFVNNIKTPRVHPRYNALMNTGRTSCTGSREGACNIQQLPRNGEIRSLFIPRENHSFLITDYSAIELSALAQVTYTLFKKSKMRELINEGRDLHKFAASKIYKMDEENVTKDQRLLAKILNFGLGANMGYKTFVEYAKQFGVILTEEEAKNLKEKWSEIFPEMLDYWNVDADFGEKLTHHTLTGRIRANCTYTAYLNTGFQGLAADGAKIALFNMEKAGIPVVAFVHDEIVSEVPDKFAEEFLKKQEKIMIDSMKKVIPDVDVKVESQITKEYCK